MPHAALLHADAIANNAKVCSLVTKHLAMASSKLDIDFHAPTAASRSHQARQSVPCIPDVRGLNHSCALLFLSTMF
jgi:hypothetical protein